ncbi:MAG: transcription-repair coupling factor [Deltaproteobacteria bacterium]|nr:transcription-repair coupling factor [Deltaproteobacteria bacterium]
MRKITEKKIPFPDPSLRALIDEVRRGARHIAAGGLHGAARPLIAALLSEAVSRPLVVVCPSPDEAARFHGDLSSFLPGGGVHLYSSREALCPEDVIVHDRELSARRVACLTALMTGSAPVCVMSLEALAQGVPPVRIPGDYLETLSMGDFLDRDEFLVKLAAGGYRRVPLVEEQGEFSVRGYIIDIFPPTAAVPLRMEFVGDELESIREFDLASQRSRREITEFLLSPAMECVVTAEDRARAVANLRARAHELDLQRAHRDGLIDMLEKEPDILVNPHIIPLLYGSPHGGVTGSVFDYFPRGTVIMAIESLGMKGGLETLEDRTARLLYKAEKEEKFHLDGSRLYLSSPELAARLEEFQQVSVDELFPEGDGVIRFHVEKNVGLRRDTTLLERDSSLLAPLAERLRRWLRERNRIIFLAAEGEMQRVEYLLRGHNFPVIRSEDSFLTELERPENGGFLILKTGALSEGFTYPALKLAVVTEEEIFGKKVRKRRRPRAREGYFLKSFGELKEGDHVVHVDHGIGTYRGLKRLTAGNIENDFLLIEYLGSDKLYLPVDRIDQIQRYIGPDGHAPLLDRLGGTSWEAVKKRVKKSVREMAEELVSVYAAREVMDGHRFSPPDRYYEEFCSFFEFEETPDQARAIEEVDLDLGEPKPMDRLICGDAGFGKTEVALRASFRVAMDGKQVAILVPTTILAEQHYQTFRKRFEKYPVRIEVLNRYRTKNRQKEIVEDIARGRVDIIIGTHRLLQKDVVFKDLGMLIIDEEQRFGVTHKERLKKLRALVEVMTLTATPIPRTLQLSLVGLRDLSVINTPPQERQSVKVQVCEFDEDTIRGALHRELERGGQVFFVHDRVRSIYSMARLVERLAPDAKVAVAHGQMKPRELEDVMVRFIRREFNILVCTTIIGSGVDMPSVNTIVINRADRFGLSSLYQLRGRVGRSSEEGYACLLIPPGITLSRDARKRLRVVQEFSEPGSGFKVATYDLEIRGAGNLLGSSQSGHISAVGFELYTELMEKAVRDLRGEAAPEEEFSPEIRLGIPAFIPDDYIDDMQTRLITYKKISAAGSDDDLEDLRRELRDRYGFVHGNLKNLMDIIGVRNLLREMRVEKMEYDGKRMLLVFHKTGSIDPARIMELSRKRYRDLRLTPKGELFVPLPGLKEEDVIAGARDLIADLRS